MDTPKDTRSRLQKWLYVRNPVLFLGLAALWIVGAVAPWIDPDSVGGTPAAVAISIVTGVLALGIAAASILNLVMRHRGLWPSEPGPLAQQSDPRLR